MIQQLQQFNNTGTVI